MMSHFDPAVGGASKSRGRRSEDLGDGGFGQDGRGGPCRPRQELSLKSSSAWSGILLVLQQDL